MRVENTCGDGLRGVHRAAASNAHDEVGAKRLRRLDSARHHLNGRIGNDLKKLLRLHALGREQLLEPRERAGNASVAIAHYERPFAQLRAFRARLDKRARAEYNLYRIVVCKTVHLIVFFLSCQLLIL